MFEYTSLLRTIAAERSWFEGDRLPVADKRGELIFQDHGADVLLVAHLDHCGEGRVRRAYGPQPQLQPATVMSKSERKRLAKREAREAKAARDASTPQIVNHYINHVALDDRLGVWALQTLIRSGLKADLLLTDCEETGQSTGEDFADALGDQHRYKFILSADRKGVGCVLYQYEDAKPWAAFCSRQLGPLEQGSFSCIAFMDSMRVCGINCGIGYWEHNSDRCWADLRLVTAQSRRIASFIAEARTQAWPFEEKHYSRYSRVDDDWSWGGFTSTSPGARTGELWTPANGARRAELVSYSESTRSILDVPRCAMGCPRCEDGDGATAICGCQVELVEVGNENWGYCLLHGCETERVAMRAPSRVRVLP